MENQSIRQSLKYIIADIDRISEELTRPDEDVVTLSVCLGARKSISNLMQLYLQVKQGKLSENSSLDDLLSDCKKQSTEFNSIDLSKVVCRDMNTKECEGKYCLSGDRVVECVDIANTLKAIIMKQLSISESELL